ncbi:MAG: pyridoxal-phosphate dependent enzyme, partial [Promethearchaeota archaeon]
MRKPLSLTCQDCGEVYEVNSIPYECQKCQGILWYNPDINIIKEEFTSLKSFSTFWDCYFCLPRIDEDFHVSIGEGGTICRHSKKLGELLELNNLYFKDETQNPTNSFKDRTAALLTSHARSW